MGDSAHIYVRLRADHARVRARSKKNECEQQGITLHSEKIKEVDRSVDLLFLIFDAWRYYFTDRKITRLPLRS